MRRSGLLTRLATGLMFLSTMALLGAACSTTETKEVAAPTVQVSGDVAIEVGETKQLTAKTLDFGDKTETYAWATNDEAVATVDAEGNVLGVAAGTALITATGADSQAVGTWGVHVFVSGGGPAATPKVVVGGPVSVRVGDSIPLVAQTIDGADASYTWSSSADAIATVADGVVTGIAEGEATITATGGSTGASGSWGVFVKVDSTATAPRVTVTGATMSLAVGEALPLTATTANGTDAGYDWTSSDDAVATVDADGVVTAVAAGQAVITATGQDTGAAGSFGVVVGASAAKVTVTGDRMALMVGETLQLAAATADGTDAGYDWASSDDAVATVDATGLVTGVAAGEAIVTATGQDTGAAGAYGVVVFARPGDPTGPGIPLLADWQGSGHADAAAEAFRHWDGDGEVSAGCARCHSGVGLPQYAAGDEVTAAPTDTVITCTTCHDPAVMALDWVEFPSGARVENVGKSARCMACHQGRESTVSVNAKIEAAAVGDDDVSADLSFSNVHYFAAGATLYGGVAMGGYQYDGKPYDVKFRHVEEYDTCTACHNPHTLQLRLDGCATCHENVTDVEDLKDVRMMGSLVDYDGDGDTTEGVYYEVMGLHEQLYAAIQDYAANTAGTAIEYNASAYPYWFDTAGARFASWTPRLLRAAYNYQYVAKDPGAFAHNGKYVIELMVDSIEDLGGAMEGIHRVDAGHFAGSEEAFRHWDAEGEVSASCARCHSATGLSTYLLTGGTFAVEPSNGMLCVTCHDGENFPARYTADDVTFPSGLVVDSGSNTTNLCMQCHQGRESGASVAALIGDLPADEVSASLRFLNVHYFAAGATRFGTQAGGGFEYEGALYNGLFAHTARFQQCNDCHDIHSLQVKVDACGECHEGVTTMADLEEIRMPGSTVDYDGDGDVEEGIAAEVEGLHEELIAAMQAYTDATAGVDGIVYNGSAYPYFFNTEGARYATWTPRLLRAAYNYQYVAKDPGAFAHNARYIVQLLWDSITDLSMAPGVTIDTSALTRNPGPHFDGTSEAFRHWDGDGEVSAGCARCHGGPAGFDAYLETFANPAEGVPISMGLTCETCHTGADYADGAPRKAVEKVVFPSGIEIMNTNGDDSFLCMTCHQGRVAKATIDDAIAAGTLRFQNIHYLAAGAIFYGTDAKVGYEYDGQTYAGKWGHMGATTTRCTFCHTVNGEEHSFEPRVTQSGCACHAGVTDVHDIRVNRAADYDGDGDNTEPLVDEIQGLAALLLGEMQTVSTAGGGAMLLYDSGAYPYFFADVNGSGAHDEGDASFSAWTAGLMKAAHNFQASQKEPGAWAHNTPYIAQLLMDSIVDLGGDLATIAPNPLVRP